MKQTPLYIHIGKNLDSTGYRYASLFFNYKFDSSKKYEHLKVRAISVPRVNITNTVRANPAVLQANYDVSNPAMQDFLVDDINCSNFFFFLFDKKGVLRVENLPAQFLIENENGNFVRKFDFDIDIVNSYVVTPFRSDNTPVLIGNPGLVADYLQITLHTIN